MSFPALYKIMEALKMPNPLNYDDTLIEFAINYWLCDNNMDVLAAYIEAHRRYQKTWVNSFVYT